jgi:hypothetical protein
MANLRQSNPALITHVIKKLITIDHRRSRADIFRLETAIEIPVQVLSGSECMELEKLKIAS